MHPVIFAHRGSSGTYAEHTRAAYLQALADGADGVECDVHLTRDGELVCIHDTTLDRTTDGSGDVADRTLDELRTVNAFSWKGVQIPEDFGDASNQFLSLADLLVLLRRSGRRIALAIELKHPSPFGLRLEEALIAFLMDEGWDPESSMLGLVEVSFMSFNPDSMRQLGESAPHHMLCQLVADVQPHEVRESLRFGSLAEGALINVLRRALKEGEDLIDRQEVGMAGPGVQYVRDHPERVRRWIEDGVRVRVWTVNTEEDALFLAALGVQELTSDYPARIRLAFGGTRPYSFGMTGPLWLSGKMQTPIEDYALVSDLHTGALISREGSIDWLCLPRFDSESVFAAMLGTPEHGRWLVSPSSADAEVVERSYIDSTFVLQTHWRTPDGDVLVTDFMPVGDRRANVIRRVQGLTGTVTMRQELQIRFGYGEIIPWVSQNAEGGPPALLAIAGPDALLLRGPRLHASDHKHVGAFEVSKGDVVDLEMVWYPSHRGKPEPLDIDDALDATISYWRAWAANCADDGDYALAVRRSLLVLRALTHEDTGGIVAAPTTSLPEHFGGARNWDYRFCWLRDAALTLEAMMTHGLADEALGWRNWLLRAVAGDPEDLQIMYGLAGERRLPERELAHLPGYADSVPVRVGNGAVDQYQADVVGEVMVALEKLRRHGVKEDNFSWPLQRALLGFAEKHLHDPDHGIWEMRGDKQYFTHSRVMMWAAFDCAVRAVRDHGLSGPQDHWTEIRDQLHAEIMERGFNRELNSFTQVYGGTEVDASLLQLPQVGFLDSDDPAMLGTVERLEQDLLDGEGLLLRYRTGNSDDGLAPGEHPFLACSFWLVEQYALSGRHADAKRLMDQLVGYLNELGLMSEEYDAVNKRMAGNFPQAFSHLALVRAADALQMSEGETSVHETMARE
ncbi:Trehalase [Arthrobacter agilis]|nr:Trehalase [Arthrobacter agilis]